MALALLSVSVGEASDPSNPQAEKIGCFSAKIACVPTAYSGIKCFAAGSSFKCFDAKTGFGCISGKSSPFDCIK